jgi:alkylated DNA nucleotide flippase Atl1
MSLRYQEPRIMAISAVDRLNAAKPVKIVRTLPEGARNWAPPGGSMVVVNAREVDALIRRVPHGRVTTLDHIRAHFAQAFGTSIACPVSTAIFINIAARAAEEMRADGLADVTPWWRVLRSDGSLNEKYPGGIGLQRAFLESEGHAPAAKGRRWVLPDYGMRLADLG